MKKTIIYSLGIILIFAGIYTLYVTGKSLLDTRLDLQGSMVNIPVAKIACFISALFYLVCGVLFFMKEKLNKLATPLLFIATIIMFIGYIGMLFHINAGRPINNLTIAEMLVRTSGTMLYAAAAWYIFTRTRIEYPKGYNPKSFKKLLKEYEAKRSRLKS